MAYCVLFICILILKRYSKKCLKSHLHSALAMYTGHVGHQRCSGRFVFILTVQFISTVQEFSWRNRRSPFLFPNGETVSVCVFIMHKNESRFFIHPTSLLFCQVTECPEGPFTSKLALIFSLPRKESFAWKNSISKFGNNAAVINPERVGFDAAAIAGDCWTARRRHGWCCCTSTND